MSVRVVEVSGRRGLYEAALRTVTDWGTFADLVERVEMDERLSDVERDLLRELANQRDLMLRPTLRGFRA